MPNNKLFDYVKRSDMERLLRGIAEMAGVALRLSDAAGETLCGPFNFTDVCQRFHFGTHPELCKASAVRRVRELRPGDPYGIFECAGAGDTPGETGAGIVDAVVPICVADEHIASINCGQVLHAPLDAQRIARFRTFATRTLGIPTERLPEYEAALPSLPIMPREQFQTILDFLHWLANLVSSYAYDHYQVARLHHLMRVTSRTPEQAVAEVLQTIDSILDGTLGISLWYCDGSGSLVLKALWRLTPSQVSRRVMPIAQSVSGRALRNRIEQFVDIPGDPEFLDATLLQAHPQCKLLAIPFSDLTGGGRDLGAAAVFLGPNMARPSTNVLGLIAQTRGMLETALHHESDLHRQGLTAAAADLLTSDGEAFWTTFDRIVLRTIPNVTAYTLYYRTERDTPLKPLRTHIFSEPHRFRAGPLGSFCRHVLTHVLAQRGPIVHHDLLSADACAQERDLFLRALASPADDSTSFSVAGVPLVSNDNRLVGGLICVAGRTAQCTVPDPLCTVFPTLATSHIGALAGLASLLSMVLARQQAEEARAVAQVVRMHELVAPLHAIMGYHENLMFMFKAFGSDVSSEVLAPFGKQLERLGYICELLSLIATSDALDGLPKCAPVNFEKGVMLPIIQPLRAYALAEKRTRLDYFGEIDKMPRLWLAADRMKQCLFNLAFNAVKYSDPRTQIDVRVTRVRRGGGDEYWEISVTNQGIGVPPDEEERIFGRFVQGSNADQVAASGSGLGLYIARAIARKHGGDVWLRDGSPGATEFVLSLPCSLADAPFADCEEQAE